MDAMKLLYPLDEFYAQAGVTLPFARPCRGEQIPAPYREVLVHSRSMTPTLEAFHQRQTDLRVLACRRDGEALRRQVVLRLMDTGRPVEFAAIVIHLRHFPLAAREEIVAGRRPLGSILRGHRIEAQNSPLIYLRLISDSLINAALHLTEPQPLYGRRNVIRDTSGRYLAETLEILPPAREDAAWGCASGQWLATSPHAMDTSIEKGALRPVGGYLPGHRLTPDTTRPCPASTGWMAIPEEAHRDTSGPGR
jgi:chorismate-pyruvate lyase